jgi:hypothetical protein
MKEYENAEKQTQIGCNDSGFELVDESKVYKKEQSALGFATIADLSFQEFTAQLKWVYNFCPLFI